MDCRYCTYKKILVYRGVYDTEVRRESVPDMGRVIVGEGGGLVLVSKIAVAERIY